MTGTSTTSSKSCPKGDCPFLESTPTTTKGMFLTRITWPTGLALGP